MEKSRRGYDPRAYALGEKLSTYYPHVIARSSYNGASHKEIAEGNDWADRFKLPIDVVIDAVKVAMRTKRVAGFLLAERMNDARRNSRKLREKL